MGFKYNQVWNLTLLKYFHEIEANEEQKYLQQTFSRTSTRYYMFFDSFFVDGYQ